MPRIRTDVDDNRDHLFELMLTETLNGDSLNDIVGSGDPREQGANALALMMAEGLVRSDSRILEIGSGCGRAAVPLLDVLSDGQYVGLDIIPGLTRFCAQNITPDWPNFTFKTLGEGNPLYTSYLDSSQPPEDLIADLSDAGSNFDLIIAFSVFTHLQPRETAHMLARCSTLLAPSGSLLFTTFLLDAFSRSAIRQGRTAYFKESPQVAATSLADDFNGPNSAVAYDSAYLASLLEAAGFASLRSVRAGSWRASSAANFQDVVVVGRAPELPLDFDGAQYLRANPDVQRAGMNPGYHYLMYGKSEGRGYGSQADTEALREDVTRVMARMRLLPSAAKTRVSHIDEGLDFLGFRIQRRYKPGTTRRVVYTYPSKKALAAIIRRVRALTRRKAHPSLAALLRQLNPVLRGWCTYFRHGVSKATFGYLDE